MSLTNTHSPSPANKHSKPNQSLIQQTAIQRAQNEKDNQTEHDSDVQTTLQLKAERDPSSDFIRPNAIIQAKLNIGKPNDKYEVEADQMADKVVSGASEKATKQALPPTPTIQKKDGKGAVEGEGAKEEEVVETDIQQKSDKGNGGGEEETTVQEKPLSESITPVVQLKELPPIQKMTGEEEQIQTKCDACGKSEEKLNVQKKCSACADKENDVQKMDESSDESEVQTKLDASSDSTEEVQQMADPQEEKIQTKCTSCGREETSAKLNVQQKCAKCESEEKVQQKSSGEGSSAGVESSLKSSKGKGSHMDDTTKGTMESGFGSDFSGVRVHTDSSAVQMNKELGSKAFTNGSDIYFNEGQYSPSSKSGQHLLAHELTHTVQQGAAPKGVQKKDDKESEEKVQTKLDASTEETSVQKKDEEEKGDSKVQMKSEASEEAQEIQTMNDSDEESVQQKLDTTIQKADDPCADTEKKKEEKGKGKYNNVTKEANCNTCYTTPIKPSENEPEPEGEEQTKDVEAKAEKTAGERQKETPPVNDDSQHEGTEPPAPGTDPTKICEEREAKSAEKENAKSGGDTEEKNDDGEKKDKKGEKKKGESLEDVANDKAKEKKNPSPKGEMASMMAVATRAAGMMKVAIETGGVMQARDGIKSIGSTPVSFKDSSSSEGLAANQKINSFLSSKSASAASVLDNGLNSVAGIKKDTDQKRKQMQADISRKRAISKAFFMGKKIQANVKTEKAILGMEAQHFITTSGISLKAMNDSMKLRTKYQKDVEKINLDHISYTIALNEKFKKGHDDHIKAGKDYGKQAYNKGKEQSKLYKKAKNEGACSEDRELVRKGEADGFWDGYLTVNRYEARAESALETGKQYQESMQESAKEAADKLLCDKKNQIQIAQGIKTLSLDNLKCALDDGLDAIELRKAASLKEADIAKAEYGKNLKATLNATLSELEQKELIQDILISDFGARQIVSLENISLQATIGLVSALKTQAGELHKQLRDYASSIAKRAVPNSAALDEELAFSGSEFDTGQQAVKSAIDASVSTALSQIKKSYTTAKSSIQTVYRKGIDEGIIFYNTYDKLTTDIDGSRAAYYTNLLQQSMVGLTADYDNAILKIDSVVTLHTHSLLGIGEQVDIMIAGRLKGLHDGMTKTVTKDLGPAICNEAEKAAKDIQPWWKSVLKVLLFILVIAVVIVLSVVTAGAFAAIGGAIFGAGSFMAGATALALSGAVMGAFSSLLITVGTNVINGLGTGELTWESAFKGAWDAVKIGFISGFIGGFAGPFIHVIRAGVGPLSSVGAIVLREGIEVAFDVVGAIAGDLWVHGEIKSWSGIFMSAFISRTINIGTKKLGPKIDAKIPDKFKINPGASKGQFEFKGFEVKAPKSEIGAVKTEGGDTNIKPEAQAEVKTPKNDGVETTNASGNKNTETGETKTKVEGETTTGTKNTTETGETKTKVESETTTGTKKTTETGETKTKVEGETTTGTKNTTETGETKTKVEGETTTGTKNTTETGETKTKSLTGGQKQAKALGYPEPPPGFHWRKGKSGVPSLVKNKGTQGSPLKYNAETQRFELNSKIKQSTGVSSGKKGHHNSPEIEEGTGIVAQYKTKDGHTIKVLKDGSIKICSTCADLDVKYREDIAADTSGNLKRRLAGVQNESDPKIKATKADKLRTDLENLRVANSSTEIRGLVAKGYDPNILDKALKNFGGNKTEYDQFLKFLNDIPNGPRNSDLDNIITRLGLGDKSMIDLTTRLAAQYRLPELDVINNFKNLYDAHMRGDAVLAQGHLQSGEFPSRPYRIREGKLAFQNSDGSWVKPPSKGVTDFVLIVKNGKLKLILGKEHSGLSGGAKSVFGAGELKFNKHGIIESINNGSGHYRPSDANLRRSFETFVQQGMFVPNKHIVGIDPITNPNP